MRRENQFIASSRVVALSAVLPVIAGLAAASCTSDDPGTDAGIDESVCDAANGPFSADITNPYLPFVVGSIHELEGLESGTDYSHFQIAVLDETAEMGGVTTRVVEKREVDEDGLGDPELEYFAQAPDETVCIFGEGEDWEAGQDGYRPGLFMPGAPEVGMIFDSVRGPDFVETGEITYLGVPFETPAGTFEDTMTVLEDGPCIKRYARGIGEIFDDGIELISY
jgi:hypothetical protein